MPALFYKATQLALVATLVFSIWGTWAMMKSDGLIALMQKLRDNGPHLLPGTSEELRRSYTGISFIDYQLTVLCVFFWSIRDNSHPHFSLHITDFCFQFAAQYGLILIEGSRSGNAGRTISYIAVWGALMQNIGVANTLPIYALLYLATSPTVHKPVASIVSPSIAEIKALPVSMILGYFVPVALMQSGSISVDEQQVWLGVWQAFPLWIAILQLILSTGYSYVIISRTGSEDNQAKAKALRNTYQFLRYISTVGHVASWAIALKAQETPEMFADGVASMLAPLNVWLPDSIYSDFSVSTIGAGAHLFLQYDRIGSSLGILILAFYLNAQTFTGAIRPKPDLIWSFIKTLCLAIFTGPVGAAVALIEERDERLLSSQAGSEKGC